MIALQRKIAILEDLEWRFSQIFEHFTPSKNEAIDLQYDAYTDLMVNLDHYVDETTEEEYERGEEFSVALIDIIYIEADDLHTDKEMVWLANVPLKTWKKSFDSEGLVTIRMLLKKYKAMANGERPLEDGFLTH